MAAISDSQNCWIRELFKSPEYYLMNAVWDRYLNVTFAIFLVNFVGSSRLLTDVWPNAKPCAIDFDEFVEINEFFKFICNFH